MKRERGAGVAPPTIARRLPPPPAHRDYALMSASIPTLLPGAAAPPPRPEVGYKSPSVYPEIGGPLSAAMPPPPRRSNEPRPISESLWAAVEPLIPPKGRTEGKHFQRRPGAGRKPIPARKVFEAIIHVLRTGTPWKSLPKSIGSSSAIHRWFDAWHAAGFFHKLWRAGLAEHEEMEGIAWEWRLREPPHSVGLGRSPRTVRDPGHTGSGADPIASIHPREWQPTRARRRRRRSK